MFNTENILVDKGIAIHRRFSSICAKCIENMICSKENVTKGIMPNGNANAERVVRGGGGDFFTIKTVFKRQRYPSFHLSLKLVNFFLKKPLYLLNVANATSIAMHASIYFVIISANPINI